LTFPDTDEDRADFVPVPAQICSSKKEPIGCSGIVTNPYKKKKAAQKSEDAVHTECVRCNHVISNKNIQIRHGHCCEIPGLIHQANSTFVLNIRGEQQRATVEITPLLSQTGFHISVSTAYEGKNKWEFYHNTCPSQFNLQQSQMRTHSTLHDEIDTCHKRSRIDLED
jgi:S-ribosylhomocysteine lyase LuxS involved in autoinducer biosynthesis